ncbi:MAG: PIG-L family deacetylase [Cytophagales bacterium]
MKKKYLFLVLTLIYSITLSFSQKTTPSAGELLLNLKKLNTLGSVLYIAAHPDDENTRMISYFANEACMRTAYLSLTRGDGGQNLIGPEKAEKMGLIRTQELLEARKKDGGIQFFSRANDFGYSKHPDETLKIWGKDEVLSDVVWIIRKFRPDVIITRFSPNSAGQTHGHHTSSAMLALEAFSMSGDKNAFPEQLEHVDTWQADRIYWNTSWWFYGRRDFDKTGLTMVDVGEFNTLLGKNYGEIAGSSRSMHKSQGFGASESKGSIEEYLDPIDGKEAPENVLEGINTNWSRVDKGEKVSEHIQLAIEQFDPENPASIVRHLISARQALANLKDDFWKEIKYEQINELILDCMGFTIEALCDGYVYAPGDSVSFNLEAINRSKGDLVISNISLLNNGYSENLNLVLKYNQLEQKQLNFKIPTDAEISNPYWLKQDHEYGLYNVEDQRLIGLPETPPFMQLKVVLKMGDTELEKIIPFNYRWVDRVKGELYRDMVIAPPVSINFLEKTLVFNKGAKKNLKVSIKAFKDNVEAKVKFEIPEGWTVNPKELNLSFPEKGNTRIVDLEISPGSSSINGTIKAFAEIEGRSYQRSFEEIDYDHIKHINYFPKAIMPLVSIDLQRKGDLLAYIKGAGDDVPEALMQMGYQIEFLDENALIQSDLSKYDAIILGVRAFNTQTWLYEAHETLMKYVYEGGNLILQYNTSRGLNFEKMGPYKFELGRDRVTVEEAKINIKVQDHPILNTPNKIDDRDFENWVQERGLYFASSWDENYVAPFESMDPGEEPTKGMLITAKYGKGYYTYTGISFFRQLPAGVPGAYRLFANLISLGK